MTYQTPCSSPENDPNDWFISRDGKQYADDDILNDDALKAILEEANREGFEGDERVTFIEQAQDRSENEATKDALRRRRHAKDKCHTECYFRTQCLSAALDGEQGHGTWGGYYEEELREVRREISRRKRRRRITNPQQ